MKEQRHKKKFQQKEQDGTRDSDKLQKVDSNPNDDRFKVRAY